jgi:hypothetical protein
LTIRDQWWKRLRDVIDGYEPNSVDEIPVAIIMLPVEFTEKAANFKTPSFANMIWLVQLPDDLHNLVLSSLADPGKRIDDPGGTGEKL